MGPRGTLTAEGVAGWYLRLNGFLQWSNFVVHPARKGSQRTDADLVGVRFPHRQELIEAPEGGLVDDPALQLSSDRIDVVLAEVKGGRCDVNESWLRNSGENIGRMLRAVGCLDPVRIDDATKALCADSTFEDSTANVRVRLLALGEHENQCLAVRHTLQLCWPQVATFLHARFRRYKHQKADVQQWDDVGAVLRQQALGDSVEAYREWLVTSVARSGGTVASTPTPVICGEGSS